jgi:hypothetical protein
VAEDSRADIGKALAEHVAGGDLPGMATIGEVRTGPFGCPCDDQLPLPLEAG